MIAERSGVHGRKCNRGSNPDQRQCAREVHRATLKDGKNKLERVNKARLISAGGIANFPRKVRSRLSMLLSGLVLCSLGSGAQGQTATEYQVKAAFLFNFAKFVEWPPSTFSDAAAPLRICVFGRNPFGEELRNITKEKTVNGHKLEVSQVLDFEVARTCQILFIASSEMSRLKQILESLRGTDALTVADTKGFVEQGGMINFVLENSRVQFEVNRKAAEQAGLKISSKLLSVAKLVVNQEPEQP